MDRLHEMEVLVAVADAGSFAAAARRLRISPAAVTRAVGGLERRLGVRLLNRTTRSVSLTGPGQRFVASARELLANLATAETEAAGESEAPSGHLTVTAPVTFGRLAVAPVVQAFLAAEPRVTASVLLLDRLTSFVDEGIDVAVRIGELADSGLVARRIGEVRPVLVASPDYLARHGTPREPADLRQHGVIAFSGLQASPGWRFVEAGRQHRLALTPRCQTNDAAVALAAAVAGEGIANALSYMVAEPLAQGRLALVLDRFAARPVPVHLLHQQGRMVAPKVRAFIDFAAPRLSAELRRFAALVADAAARAG